MKVPVADLHTQYLTIKPEIDAAIARVLESSQFVLGKAVADFERDFAEAHRARHCVGTGSGTDALHLALWALGIGPGDAVVTTPFTFIATVEAIALTGARPLFVDIDPRTFTMDPGSLAALLSRGGGGVKAVLPVHLYGQAAAMDEIAALAGRQNAVIVEDACQAHLAELNGSPVGRSGAAACFSFYPGKNLGAYGEAGAVTTNDEALAEKMRRLRDHGQVEKYRHAFPGHNYRMDGIQGAVLGVKLRHLREWTGRRRELAARYRALLNGAGDVLLPYERPTAGHVYHLFVIRTKQRDALQRYLAERDITATIAYPVPLHLQEACRGLGYKKGDFPASELAAAECLSLPLYPEMSDDQLGYVASAVRSFFDHD